MTWNITTREPQNTEATAVIETDDYSIRASVAFDEIEFHVTVKTEMGGDEAVDDAKQLLIELHDLVKKWHGNDATVNGSTTVPTKGE